MTFFRHNWMPGTNDPSNILAPISWDQWNYNVLFDTKNLETLPLDRLRLAVLGVVAAKTPAKFMALIENKNTLCQTFKTLANGNHNKTLFNALRDHIFKYSDLSHAQQLSKRRRFDKLWKRDFKPRTWPLQNLAIGTAVTEQKHCSRVVDLFQVPAVAHWVFINEPEVNFRIPLRFSTKGLNVSLHPRLQRQQDHKLDLVVVQPHKANNRANESIRTLVSDCRLAGVPFRLIGKNNIDLNGRLDGSINWDKPKNTSKNNIKTAYKIYVPASELNHQESHYSILTKLNG